MSTDAEDRQLIGQTLFFVITALLIALIVAISFLAALKFFLLPRRRKQAERRRRAARARLTRLVSSQDGGPQSTESQPHPGSGESAPLQQQSHPPCSRASSSVSVSSESSQWSGLSLSLTRLLSLYGLKKTRQEHRCSLGGGGGRRIPTTAGEGPVCLYNAQRSGVIIRVPDYSSACEVVGGGGFGFSTGADLPPSYEEAMMAALGQSAVLAGEALVVQSGPLGVAEALVRGTTPGEAVVGRQSARGEAAGGQSTPGEALVQNATPEEAAEQSTPGEALVRSATPGEAVGRQSTPGEAVTGQSTPGEAVTGQSTPGEAKGQRALGETLLQSTLGEAEAAGQSSPSTLGEATGQRVLGGPDSTESGQ